MCISFCMAIAYIKNIVLGFLRQGEYEGFCEQEHGAFPVRRFFASTEEIA